MKRLDGSTRSPVMWQAYLVALTLIAFLLRAHRLAAQNLWSDEDITLDRAALGLSEMLSNLPVEHAPLYFVLMRGWSLLVGDGDLSLRFPSLAAGVVAVPLMAYLGARLVSRPTGLVAALLMAINPFLVWYGQEARMYAVVCALALGALAAVIHGERSGGLRWWVAGGALAAAAVLGHYYAAVIVFVLAAWAIMDIVAARRALPSSGRESDQTTDPTPTDPLRPETQRSVSRSVPRSVWRSVPRSKGRSAETHMPEPRLPESRSAATHWAVFRWAALGITATVLFLPWLPRAVGVLGFSGWREPVALSRVPWMALSAWSAGPTAPAGPARWATLLFVAATLIGLVSLPIRLRDRDAGGHAYKPYKGDGPSGGRLARGGPETVGARRLLVYAFVPLATVAILLLRTPDFHPRYLMAAVPAFYLLAATGVAKLPSVAAVVVAVAFVLGAVPPLASLYGDPTQQKQDYRAVMTTIEAWAGPEDTALVLDGPPFGMMQRYRADESPVKIIDTHRSSFQDLSSEGLFDAITERTVDRDIIWLAEDGDMTGVGREWMATHACPVEETSVQDITLGRYVHRPGSFVQPSMNHGHVTMADLQLAIDSPATVRAGNALPVQLLWRVDPSATSAYRTHDHKVSVRLVDDTGNVVAAADRRPVSGTRATTTWNRPEDIYDCHALLVPADVDPRGYMLEVVLYDEDNLEPLDSWTHRLIVSVSEPVSGRGVPGDGGTIVAIANGAQHLSERNR